MSDKLDFWGAMIGKLNASTPSVPKMLQELCEFLKFGSGFSYYGDYENTFHLQDSYCLKGNVLPKTIFMGPEDRAVIDELLQQKLVAFRSDTCSTNLEKRLSEIFGVNSLILLPIINHQNQPIGLIGIADRRGTARTSKDDMAFSTAVLGILASYVKTDLYQKRIDTTQKALEGMVNHMGVDIYVNDFNTHEILYVNRSMAAPYGGVENMMGRRCWQALYDDKTGPCEYCPQLKLIDENGQPTKVYSWDYQRPFDGAWFNVLSAAFQWVDGRLAHVVSSIDITQKKKSEEIIRRMAEYDILTSLPNRSKMIQDFENAMRHSPHAEMSVLFFDLDGFKTVNDSLGHKAGDELLVQVAKSLQKNPLIAENCYRYGGDEFVILCRNNKDDLFEIISFLHAQFDQPFLIEGNEVSCKASLGVSLYPYDEQVVAELIRKADYAMYRSKSGGGSQTHFYNRGNICTASQFRALQPTFGNRI